MKPVIIIDHSLDDRKGSTSSTKSFSKMKLGNIMTNIRKVGVGVRKESVSGERPDSQAKSPATSSGSASVSQSSPSTIRRMSDKDKKKPSGSELSRILFEW